jgi:hypothetical protein
LVRLAPEERWLAPSLLFIVAQNEPGIYENLQARFGGLPTVQILRDRRVSDRRRRSGQREQERRASDRRQYLVDDRLKSVGYAVLMLP